jgi:hypothetical protein
MEGLMEAMMGRVMHGVGSFWVFCGLHIPFLDHE